MGCLLTGAIQVALGRARDLESLGVGVVIVSGARCGLDMSTSFQLTTSTENLRKEVVNEELSIK